MDTILTFAGLAIVCGGVISKITIPNNAAVRNLEKENAAPAAGPTAA
jgi:hypothetical protein